MPVHDWKRVFAGTFHDFHLTWITLLKHVLNHDVLPEGYYALAEQAAGEIVPDVLTLRAERPPDEADDDGEVGGTAVAVRPPRVSYSATLEAATYARRRNRLVIRHKSRNRVIAILEIVSPGNKSSRQELDAFVTKATEALHQGINLLVIDLHRPTKRDPYGIHGAIWSALGDSSYKGKRGKPLTLAAYAADEPIHAYVERLEVGDSLPSMPLFLSPTRYVDVPLEASYMQAVAEIPKQARAPLEK